MRRSKVLVEGDGMSEVQGFIQNIDPSLLGSPQDVSSECSIHSCSVSLQETVRPSMYEGRSVNLRGAKSLGEVSSGDAW